MSGLANVSLRPRSVGLADVYRSTALLLVPSQCPEAFSRVVLEACANGIPVLASRAGGVPEAMGESGVLLDPADSADRWARAIEEILAGPGPSRAGGRWPTRSGPSSACRSWPRSMSAWPTPRRLPVAGNRGAW